MGVAMRLNAKGLFERTIHELSEEFTESGEPLKVKRIVYHDYQKILVWRDNVKNVWVGKLCEGSSSSV